MYAVFIAYTFTVGVVGGVLAAVAAVQSRRERAARQNRLGQSREPRPPLPRRLPERVHTADSCHCADCDALVEQLRITVAVALARAEAASIDSEWAEMNGGAS